MSLRNRFSTFYLIDFQQIHTELNPLKKLMFNINKFAKISKVSKLKTWLKYIMGMCHLSH